MTKLIVPDYPQLESWLEAADIEFYKCDSCNGLHLPHMQAETGVLDSKLDIEGDILFFTTTAEVRPSRITTLLGEIGEINANHPLLKVFLDINDETLPVLVCCHNLPMMTGITPAQVLQSMEVAGEQMREVIAHCNKKGHFCVSSHHEEVIERIEAALLH